MPCKANQDRQVMVESSDKMWSAGDGNGKPLQYSCLCNPMNGLSCLFHSNLGSGGYVGVLATIVTGGMVLLGLFVACGSSS